MAAGDQGQTSALQSGMSTPENKPHATSSGPNFIGEKPAANWGPCLGSPRTPAFTRHEACHRFERSQVLLMRSLVRCPLRPRPPSRCKCFGVSRAQHRTTRIGSDCEFIPELAFIGRRCTKLLVNGHQALAKPIEIVIVAVHRSTLVVMTGSLVSGATIDHSERIRVLGHPAVPTALRTLSGPRGRLVRCLNADLGSLRRPAP